VPVSRGSCSICLYCGASSFTVSSGASLPPELPLRYAGSRLACLRMLTCVSPGQNSREAGFIIHERRVPDIAARA
jgi:hypothetical protein